MDIHDFLNLVQEDKSPTQHKFSLGKISTQQVEQIKEQMGLDLTGYEHFLENFGIKHTLSQHGNKKKEALRGQIAVEITDFEYVKSILEEPDKICTGFGKNKAGRELILYEKNIHEVFYYIEEIRTKNKELITQTLYKRKSPKNEF